MGITLCNKHDGYHGIAAYIENELAEKLTANIPVDQNDIAVVYADFFDDNGTWLVRTNYLLYKSTIKQHGIQIHYNIKSDEEEFSLIEDAWRRKLCSGIMCYTCFKEYTRQHHWDITFSIL